MSGHRKRKIVKALESGHVDDVYNALVELRTQFKPDDAYAVMDCEMMKRIIPFIEYPRLSSISLSIIANACLHSSLRIDVLRNDGVKHLVRVMKTLANDSIQTRACRALGNIALCQEGLAMVHKYKAVPHIVSLLTTTDDKSCKMTAIRTLRILGSGPQNSSKVTSEKGVFAISELLQSEDVDIIQCAVKAVAVLTQHCSVECATQLQDADGLNVLMKLSAHSEMCIRDNAVRCLENLSGQSVIRPQLGSVGAIPLFVDVANSESEYKDIKYAVLSLCFCCREDTNRIRMKESMVFPLLVKVLSDETYSEIHENIVLSLLCFRYNQGNLQALIDCDLIKTLVTHLQSYMEKHKSQFLLECCDSHLPCMNPKFTLLNSECRTDQEELKSPVKESNEQSSSDTEEFLPHQYENYIMNETDSKETAVEGERDCTFSIHSPSYQEFKTSEKYLSDTGSYCDPVYVNFCSPVTSGNCSSPDRISVDFSMHSPSSCSSGPYSPFSFTEEVSDTPVCFSPIMGSPVSESSEKPDTYDLESFSGNEKDVAFANSDLPCSGIDVASQKNTPKKIRLEVDLDSVFKEPPSPLENQRRGKPNGFEKNCQLELSPSSPKQCSLLQHKKKPFKKNSFVNHIIILLGVLSKCLKFTTKIAEKTCIEVLMDYLILLPEPEEKVHRIFVRLLGDRKCFERLVYFNFFGLLDEKIRLCPEVIDCTRCTELKDMHRVLKDNGTTVAKSAYGIGLLAHHLLTGNVKAQLNSIYTFSKLVDEKKCLEKLLIDSDGLAILLEFLTSSNPSAFEIATVSLSRIYHSLNNSPRHFCEKSWWQEKKTTESSEQPVCQYLSCSHDVSFKLDSEEIVEASRSAVCEKSDFFQALLHGHFSEAHKSVVSLSGVSSAALSTTFHFLHGCLEDSCNFLKSIQFDVLLELLCVFDKYFIFEFKQSIERQLLSGIEMGRAQKIYLSSKEYNYPTLAKHALHFILLASEMEKKELLKCTRDLLDQSKIDVLNDIRNSLKDMLPGSRDHPLYTRRNSTSM